MMRDTSAARAGSRAVTDAERRFLDACRVARLATADAAGRPHVVPVCFAVAGDTCWIAIDEKPKQAPARGRKWLRNIAANPHVALVADRWDEDWSRLGWVMLRGRALVLEARAEHADALAAVRARYPQLRPMRLEDRPVIALRIERVSSWGALD